MSRQAVDDVASHIAISNAIEQYNLKSGITYHSSIKKSKDFSDLFPVVHEALGRNSVKVTNVHSSMSSAMRQERLSMLSYGGHRPAFVTNCRLLSEGVDVPTLDFIGVIDPKSSVTELIQIIGRVMRQADGKQIGTVVVPVIVEEEADSGFQLKHSSYEAVYRVVKSLRAHDKIFGETIDHIRAATGTSIIPRTKLVDNFERRIDIAALGLDADALHKLAQMLKAKVIEHSCDTVEVFIEQLADWIKKTGREPTPKQDWQLSSFCQRQRILRGKGKLSQERIEALDSIGFRWVTQEDNFSDRIKELVDFIAAHGRYPKQKEGILGRWVTSVRQRYREGKLEKERIDALNRIGFIWNEKQQAWTEKAQAVKNFVSRYGRLPKQRPNATREERALAYWISNQTSRYKSGQLSEDQINTLRSLGIDLPEKPKTKKERWYENFDRVREYKRKYGVVPPQSTGSIANWVIRQRQLYKKGQLDQEYIDALNSISFPWTGSNNKDITWFQWLEKLKRHIEKYGNEVENYPTSGPLYAWILRQRIAYKKGKLSKARIDALNSIGFHWRGRQRSGDK